MNILNRLRMMHQVMTANFVIGVSSKDKKTALFLNGAMDIGNSLPVAEKLLELTDTMIDANGEALVDLGLAKEAKILHNEYVKIKRK